MNIPLFCEMLIDQNRYIGDDPVGYKCSNSAVQTVPFANKHYLICESCLAKYNHFEERGRLSITPMLGGDTPEDAIQRAEDSAKRAMECIFHKVWNG